MFFKSKSRNKIKGLEKDNDNGRLYNMCSTAVSIALVVGFIFIKNDITVHIPPDISGGASLKEHMVPEENVYLFAGSIWKALNYWETDGKTEMKNNIDMYRCYLTPTFATYLKTQHDQRVSGGMTQDVARTANSIKESPYSAEKVTPESKGQWEAVLDLRIQESMGSNIIRNVPLRYRLTIVTDDSSAHCNPWNLKIAALKEEPVRLITADGGNL